MTKQLGCRDVGVDCEWSATADTEEELMVKVVAHAKDGHGFDPIPDEHLAKIKASIKDI